MRFVFSLMVCILGVLCGDVVEIPLGELGGIRYVRDAYEHVLRVERVDALGEVMYVHGYHYDESGILVRESLIGDLGEVVYEGDVSIRSPYGEEICEYDENYNLVRQIRDGVAREYVYNEFDELVAEEGVCESEFVFDEKNRLVRVITAEGEIEYGYDDISGLRMSRTVNGEIEYPLYFGMNEMAVLDSEAQVKELRIPGISHHRDILRAVAIEIKGAIYAPIHDIQGNIVKLIDIDTREVISLDWADPYGRGLSKGSPTSWIFSGKSYDKEADLVYFGARYYSPALKRWLTPDPLYQMDDPYEYCFNNPFAYVDPDGRWAFPLIAVVWGAGATVTAPFWGPCALAVGAGAAAGYAGCKAYEYWQENRSSAQDLQKQIQKDHAPESVDRADKGKGPFEKDHVHFKDDNAINHDGTWKHGERDLTRKEKEWLQKNGWKIPGDK